MLGTATAAMSHLAGCSASNAQQADALQELGFLCQCLQAVITLRKALVPDAGEPMECPPAWLAPMQATTDLATCCATVKSALCTAGVLLRACVARLNGTPQVQQSAASQLLRPYSYAAAKVLVAVLQLQASACRAEGNMGSLQDPLSVCHPFECLWGTAGSRWARPSWTRE